MGCYVAQIAVRGQDFRFDGYDKAFLFVFGFLGLFCLAIQNLIESISVDKCLNAALLIGFGLIMYSIAKNIDLNSTMIRFVFWCFSIGALINAASLALEFYVAPSGLRLTGYADNPNTVGYHFGLALLIILGNYFDKRESRMTHTVVVSIVCLVFLLAMLISQSRGAMVAFGGAAATLLIVNLRKRDTRLRVFIMVSLSSLLGVSLLAFSDIDLGFTMGRITGDHVTATNALSGRDEIWSVAWSVAQDSSFRGIGLGQFYHVSGGYLEDLLSRNYVFGSVGAHSDYFTLLAETGLLGLTSYIILVGCLTTNLLRRSLVCESGGMYSVLLSLVVFMSLAGATHGSFKRPDFWLFMALATLVCRDRFQVSATNYVRFKVERR